MKIHITNLYNFIANDQMVIKQHRFADAGRSLGFHEMGIFSYPVATDSSSELSKRLDGIIAALEPEDVVIIQLPTENGYEYEQLLFHKIKAYRDTRIALLFHDMTMFSDTASPVEQENYMSLCKKADAVIVPTNAEVERLQKEGILQILTLQEVQLEEDIIATYDVETKISNDINCNGYKSLCENGFYIKKLLLDTVNKLLSSYKHIEKSVCVNQDDIIQIGFGLHDKTGTYSVWVGTAMQSIIEHTDSKICFHILIDDTVSDENKNNLSKVAVDGGHKICFHLIDKSLFENLYNQVKQFTIGAMFRIMLPELLPDTSKIIYLDADVLVNRDISELWNVNIEDYYMAAVPDVGAVRGLARPIPVVKNIIVAECYFNSGVLVLNLDSIREYGNMREQTLDYLRKNVDSFFPDQDALNVIYKDKILFLDESWNYFARIVHDKKESIIRKAIYHYASTRCILYSMLPMDQLYFETIGRTPWGEVTCRNLLNNSMNRMNDRIIQLEKVVKQISTSRKKHVFYGAETMAMKNIYKILKIQEGDYRVLEKPLQEDECILPCKELAVLENETEEVVVFVLPEADNGSAISRLEKMGMHNEEDFFVIPRVLSSEQGGYI